MTKSSKIPVIKAFCVDNQLKEHITIDDLFRSCKDYYYKDYRREDLCLIGHIDYKEATENDFLKWAKKNPFKYLSSDVTGWFYMDDNGELAISNIIYQYKDNITFLNHFVDALEYRSELYFFNKRNKRG